MTAFYRWVNERHAVALRKAMRDKEPLPPWADPAGVQLGRFILPPLRGDHPLTDDSVMQQYKFCHAFRELDRVTRWIAEHIREPFAEHENLWLMLAIARLLNWPPTLFALIGSAAWPSSGDFRPGNLTRALLARRSEGVQVETGAYIVTAGGTRKGRPWCGWSKQRYLAEVVIGSLWNNKHDWEHQLNHLDVGVEWCWETLVSDPGYEGWGPFMAWQLVLEWRETRYLRAAPDRDTWAAVGPGSRRGLNRLHGRPVRYGLRQEQALGEMRELVALSPEYLAPWVPPITVADCQHQLCEVDKWLRVKQGEGRPRSRYRPFEGWPD